MMIESAAGESIAAPSPWAARAAKSASALPAVAARDRGEREQAQSGHEHAAAAEEVGGATAEKQQAAEDQRVARDRPADVAAVDPEAAGHIGQRDVDGRDVEDDHQLGGAEHQQQLLQAPVAVAMTASIVGVRRLLVRGMLWQWSLGMAPPCSPSRASTSGQHPEIVRGPISAIADTLVGRQEELRRFDDALDGLAAGAAGAIEVVGAAGIGKTRLLAEVAARADARGHIVLRGAAADLERDIAFWVFIDALDEYVESVEPRRLEQPLGRRADGARAGLSVARDSGRATRWDSRASATG